MKLNILSWDYRLLLEIRTIQAKVLVTLSGSNQAL
jgi:hypothetical protein